MANVVARSREDCSIDVRVSLDRMSDLAPRWQSFRQPSIRTLDEPIELGLGAVWGPSSVGAAISVAASGEEDRKSLPRAKAQYAVA